MEYILQKENELREKESKIKIIQDCTNKNERLEKALININQILSTTGIINKTENTKNIENKIIIGVEDVEDVEDNEIDLNLVSSIKQEQENIYNQTEQENIYNQIITEVPIDYIA